MVSAALDACASGHEAVPGSVAQGGGRAPGGPEAGAWPPDAVVIRMADALPAMGEGTFEAAGNDDAKWFGMVELSPHLKAGRSVVVDMDGLHYMPSGAFFEAAVGTLLDGDVEGDVVRERLSFVRGKARDPLANAIASRVIGAATAGKAPR